MNGRIIKFEGSVHAEADRLLPWYINGTLEGDECMQVEKHLAECEQCQREATWLRTLQKDFAEQAQKDHTLSKGRRPQRKAQTPGGARPEWSAQRRRWQWLSWLAAMQAAIILALGAIVFWPQHAPYRTLSAPDDRGPLLVVVFDPHISEAQMRELIRAQAARIVGGPTEGGAYVLRVPNGHEATTRKALLQSRQVTLAEYLSSGSNP